MGKRISEKTYTLKELRELAEKFNRMPWAFPSVSQKEWLIGFIETLENRR